MISSNDLGRIQDANRALLQGIYGIMKRADKHLVKIGVNFSTEEQNLVEWAVK